MPTPTRKILVHTCCTACASHVFSELSRAGFEVISFFYHPEIGNFEEYEKRLFDLERYCEENKYKLIVPEYEPEEFSLLIEAFKDRNSIKYITDLNRYRRRRCELCNSLAIQKTIEQTRRLKLKYFTTSLLCSPYKDHDQIIDIANEKSLDYNLNFYYQDFRKGYWMGRNYARNHRVYVSSICGCLESNKEKRLE